MSGEVAEALVVAPLRPSGNALSDVRPIPLGRLKIDPEVQRTKLDMNWVAWLVANWTQRKIGVLVVSVRPNGELVVLDGWHRLVAMRILEENGSELHSATCELLFNLTAEEEAAVFLGRNDSRNVHVIDKFKIRVREGEPVAKRISEILHRNGACVDFSAEIGYACVVAVERAFHHGVLEPTIGILESCWGRSEPRTAHTAHCVEGMTLLLRNYRDHRLWNEARAKQKFGEGPSAGRHSATLADMLKRAKGNHTATGDAVYVELARLFRQRYDHQAKNRLPEVQPMGR